jgi:hypothetical protein
MVDFEGLCGESVRDLEPIPPWEPAALTLRVRCYQVLGDEVGLAAASRDLANWRANEPTPLLPPGPAKP